MRAAHQGAHLAKASRHTAVRTRWAPAFQSTPNPGQGLPFRFCASLTGPADGFCPDGPGTAYSVWCWKVPVPGVPWRSHPQCWRQLASLLWECRLARDRSGDARPVTQCKASRPQPDNGSGDCRPSPANAGQARLKEGGEAAWSPPNAASLRSAKGKPPSRICLIPLSAAGC